MGELCVRQVSSRVGGQVSTSSSRRARAKRATWLVALLTTLSFLALAASSASAAVPKHQFLETFGSSAQPTFAIRFGMVVDQLTGDVCVVDVRCRTVGRYEQNGMSANFWLGVSLF